MAVSPSASSSAAFPAYENSIGTFGLPLCRLNAWAMPIFEQLRCAGVYINPEVRQMIPGLCTPTYKRANNIREAILYCGHVAEVVLMSGNSESHYHLPEYAESGRAYINQGLEFSAMAGENFSVNHHILDQLNGSLRGMYDILETVCRRVPSVNLSEFEVNAFSYYAKKFSYLSEMADLSEERHNLRENALADYFKCREEQMEEEEQREPRPRLYL